MRGPTGPRGPTGGITDQTIAVAQINEVTLVQDILSVGSYSATVAAMNGLFVRTGDYLEPIDPGAEPSIFDQLFAQQILKGKGNYVYDVVASIFIPLSGEAAVTPTIRPELAGPAAGGIVFQRIQWVMLAAFMMKVEGKYSPLRVTLQTLFKTRDGS